MHNLEDSIKEWRQNMLATSGINRAAVDELENHLRESVDQLVSTGLNKAEAFQTAAANLGSAPELSGEFRKLDTSIWWPVIPIIGVNILLALSLGRMLLSIKENNYPLLICYTFVLAMSCISTLSLGSLGICFTWQHCLSSSSPSRLGSFLRTNYNYSAVATSLTAIAFLLGLAMSHTPWRPLHMTSLCLFVWLICYMSMHRVRNVNARSIIITSICGNIIILISIYTNIALLFSYRALPVLPYLATVLAIHLASILAALSPAGSLRFRRASA